MKVPLSAKPFDFFMSAPTENIQAAIPRTQRAIEASKSPICSISGGADSDIMLDMIYRLDPDKKVRYVTFDTGLEMQATKDHLEDLEQRYGIKIVRIKPRISAAAAVKRIGYPFWTKQVSEYMSRLQRHGFDWSDGDFDTLYARYPKCKAALRWWCNAWGDNSRLNIERSKYLKEFIMQNHPGIPISPRCCDNGKKNPAKDAVKMFDADLSMVGVRQNEGGARSTVYTSCFLDNKHLGIKMHFPIFWFTDEDKKEYEEAYDIVHSRAYTVYGCTRTGCAGCPFGSNFSTEVEMLEKYEPQLANGVKSVFGPVYEYTKQYREFKDLMKSQSKTSKNADYEEAKNRG